MNPGQLRTAAVAALVAATVSGTATAAPVVYSGYDIGSTSLAASPLATGAAADFDLAAGVVSVIDFEGALPLGVGVAGGVVGDAANVGVCATAALHCYATSPTNVYRNNGATFTFANPIDSFGAYFTGWQLGGQSITIGYLGGGSVVLNMPMGNAAGGTLFFGFIDAGASISSITYLAGLAGSNQTDAVGIDDVRLRATVPEPAALTLLGVGLAATLALGRRGRGERRSLS